VRAPPDGYALLLVGSPNAINATLYDNLNFNFIRDIAPIAGLIHGALVMGVHPSVPAKTLPEFIAYAKANPGKLSYGSGGVGGITHITAELFKQEAGGLDIQHVPYRGVAPALTDLLGGQVQVLFINLAPSIGYIGTGKLRALAITTATRSEALPDIPTVGEFVPGYEASSVFGLGAPRNTPAEIIDKLNKEINAALADPQFKARLANLDGTVLAGSPADFAKLIADETEKWGKVIKFANVKPADRILAGIIREQVSLYRWRTCKDRIVDAQHGRVARTLEGVGVGSADCPLPDILRGAGEHGIA